MRNVAAQIDDDFDLVAPPRKRALHRVASGKRGKAKRFSFKFDAKKVARYSGVAITAIVALGILVNALMMQKGNHPAPLFGKSILLGQPPVLPPAKAERKATKAPVAVETPDRPPLPVAPKQETPAKDVPAKDVSKSDPIARLLQDNAPPPSDKPSTKTVFGVQHALVKLGFVLKPNGNFGPQTKKAIEMFEKERHLPVKGELSRRIIKILAAESGTRIEN